MNFFAKEVFKWSKLPIFWKFQSAGWTAFALLTLPLKVDLTGSLLGGIFLMSIREGSSFLITLALRCLYCHARRRRLSAYQVTVLILMTSSVGAILQMLFFIAVHQFVPFGGEILDDASFAFEVFYERLGLLVGWSGLYFAITQMIEGLQTEVQLVRAESARREVELQMLRAQINPHFLFNSLNTILCSLEHNRPGISQMLQALSDYLNYALLHKNDDLVALGEEADALNNYIILEKARMGNDLDISCAVAPEAKTVRVPGVLLQPLVENAIKYGRETWSPPVIVRLKVARENANVLIEVFNTGHWVSTDPNRTSGGIGLENIRRRLEWLFPGRSCLRISPEDGWVSIQIRIPAEL
ncbi:MAG: hypothetical protein BGO12_22055 [Verrucomicrobia bacterium 61-8]|nr:MAG: hypothetical protein BGO12_22055 [Verrucomicrobia bacterium 61-8]